MSGNGLEFIDDRVAGDSIAIGGRLLDLEYAYRLSDAAAVARWVEDPYHQHFAGGPSSAPIAVRSLVANPVAQSHIHERTAPINRISGLLFAQGIWEVEPRLWRSRIDFGVLRIAEGHPISPRLRAELEREYVCLDMVEDQLRAVEKERDLADAQYPALEVKRQRLEQLPCVCGAASSIMAREVFARSFASRRYLKSYL